MHTQLDAAAFIAAGIDPETSQERDRPVPCTVCSRSTLNLRARCDAHYLPPSRVLAIQHLQSLPS